MNKRISIMDVTVRDGSYSINYSYTPEQVALLAHAMDMAGIDYMEVSHGCGLGASKNLGLKAAASDDEYVKAAKSKTKHIKVGVIAGGEPVTTPIDIDSVINHIDFIRFAVNSDQPETASANLKYLKKRRPDVEIFFQMMRANRASTQLLVESALRLEDMGASTIYVVDTAGHMMPDEIEEKISSMLDRLKCNVGFHGHNNLNLAIANSIAAIKAGATFIDASLKGMGRSAGNAQMETLALLLERLGIRSDIDVDEIIIAGDKIIEPIAPRHAGTESIDLLTARANIDMYPLSIYERFAHDINVNLTELIEKLGAEKNMTEIDQKHLTEVAKKMGGNDINSALTNAGIIKTKDSKDKRTQANITKYKAVLAFETSEYNDHFSDELLNWLREKFPKIDFILTSYSKNHIEGIEDADIIYTYELTPKLLSSAPKLKWFHSAKIIVDNNLLPGFIKRSIKVTAPSTVYSVPMAETAVGLMLALARKINDSIVLQAHKKYDPKSIITATPPIMELSEKTVTLIGIGGIGDAIAMKCRGLDMGTIGIVPALESQSNMVDVQLPFDKLDEALKISDFVIPIYPLAGWTNTSTNNNKSRIKEIIGSHELEIMKETAYLINIVRPELVNEDTLVEALKNKAIGGAACGVFSNEPLPKKHPLFDTPNTIILPHTSGISASRWVMAAVCFANNLQSFIDDDPLVDRIDINRGY